MTEHTRELTRLFKTPPRPSQVRFAEAYLMMAKAKYRPAAPGDGMGNISLSEEELKDHDRLLREAVDYANRFHEEEDTLKFHIGITTTAPIALSFLQSRLRGSWLVPAMPQRSAC